MRTKKHCKIPEYKGHNMKYKLTFKNGATSDTAQDYPTLDAIKEKVASFNQSHPSNTIEKYEPIELEQTNKTEPHEKPQSMSDEVIGGLEAIPLGAVIGILKSIRFMIPKSWHLYDMINDFIENINKIDAVKQHEIITEISSGLAEAGVMLVGGEIVGGAKLVGMAPRITKVIQKAQSMLNYALKGAKGQGGIGQQAVGGAVISGGSSAIEEKDASEIIKDAGMGAIFGGAFGYGGKLFEQLKKVPKGHRKEAILKFAQEHDIPLSIGQINESTFWRNVENASSDSFVPIQKAYREKGREKLLDHLSKTHESIQKRNKDIVEKIKTQNDKHKKVSEQLYKKVRANGNDVIDVPEHTFEAIQDAKSLIGDVENNPMMELNPKLSTFRKKLEQVDKRLVKQADVLDDMNPLPSKEQVDDIASGKPHTPDVPTDTPNAYTFNDLLDMRQSVNSLLSNNKDEVIEKALMGMKEGIDKDLGYMASTSKNKNLNKLYTKANTYYKDNVKPLSSLKNINDLVKNHEDVSEALLKEEIKKVDNSVKQSEKFIKLLPPDELDSVVAHVHNRAYENASHVGENGIPTFSPPMYKKELEKSQILQAIKRHREDFKKVGKKQEHFDKLINDHDIIIDLLSNPEFHSELQNPKTGNRLIATMGGNMGLIGSGLVGAGTGSGAVLLLPPLFHTFVGLLNNKQTSRLLLKYKLASPKEKTEMAKKVAKLAHRFGQTKHSSRIAIANALNDVIGSDTDGE